MKEIFKGYYRRSDSEIKEIWNDCIITFDANVLLNLYRYSKETQIELFKIIEKFSNKIWLTHQACLEYNRNRCEVISEQEKTYRVFRKNIEQIETELKNSNRPPFLSKKLHSKLSKVFSDVKKEVDNNSLLLSKMISKDKIYDKINLLFVNKVGMNFSNEAMQKIYKEGEDRYKTETPPGYADKSNKSGLRKYGDLILWKQIIEKSKELQKPIIFITDEQKRDWWWKLKDGRTIGPRQELIEELWNESKKDFLMYSSERFLTYGSDLLKETLNQQAIKEIAERQRILSESRKKKIVERNKYSNNNNAFYYFDKKRIKYDLRRIEEKIRALKSNEKMLSEEELGGLKLLKKERKKIMSDLDELYQPARYYQVVQKRD